MHENDFKVVRITNISNFDFTPEMGARYGGRDFFVPAGGSLLMPYPVGRHLAKHLAQQIILRGAPVRDMGEIDGKGSDRPLWDQAKLDTLKGKIMSDMYTEEKPRVRSEADIFADKVEQLNKVKSEVEEQPTTEATTDATGAPGGYKDKGEVIAALEAKGITFDARKSKADLEKLLA